MKDEVIQTITFNNAESFLGYIRRSNDQWWDSAIRTAPWVFRGHWNAEWDLMPSAWRENSNIRKLTEEIFRVHPDICHKIEEGYFFPKNDEISRTIIGEYEGIYQFAVLADKIGKVIPQRFLSNSVSPLVSGLRFNSKMAREMREEIGPLAQHHGIPTSFIDWSFNPLFATFFAVSTRFRTVDTPSNICVWACNTNALRELILGIDSNKFVYDVGVSVLRAANGSNQYLTAQQGLFTQIQGCGDLKPQDEIVTSLSNISKSRDTVFRKMLLPASEIDHLLELLDRENINDAYLMPSMDNVANTVVSRWENIEPKL